MVGHLNTMIRELAATSYEARQRRPGDYEAQVGQRPIAIHALEHLGATDRGRYFFPGTRFAVASASVQDGRDPAGLCRDAGTRASRPIRTTQSCTSRRRRRRRRTCACCAKPGGSWPKSTSPDPPLVAVR